MTTIKVYYLTWHDEIVIGTDPDNLFSTSAFFSDLVRYITLSPVVYVGVL